MWIRRLRSTFAVLIIASLFSAGVAKAQNSPAAQRVLNRARTASGGAGWNALRGIHEVGDEAGGRYERWTDPVRYGDRTETQTPAGTFVQGYNGGYEWRILTNGAVTGSVEPEVTARVRTEAFFAAYAYFFPSRFDLRSIYLGERQSRGRRFEVLRVQPAGGRPRELWFERATGLLGLLVDETGGRRLTTELSDYRRVGPVLVPHLSVTYGADLVPRRRSLQQIDFIPVDRNLFTLSPERVHRKR